MQASGHRGGLAAAAVVAAALVLSGCATVDRSIALTKETVTPLTVGDAVGISAMTLPRRCCAPVFARPDPARRTGGAQRAGDLGRRPAALGKLLEALFAVHGDRLYVTSRSRGTFVQPLWGMTRVDAE